MNYSKRAYYMKYAAFLKECYFTNTILFKCKQLQFQYDSAKEITNIQFFSTKI